MNKMANRTEGSRIRDYLVSGNYVVDGEVVVDQRYYPTTSSEAAEREAKEDGLVTLTAVIFKVE